MGGIIWLASYPKSGNTWTRTFLHNFLLDPDTPTDINAIGKVTLADGSKKWYERVSGKSFESFTPKEIAELTPRVHEAFTKTRPGSVFVKTHSAIGSLYDTPLISLNYTAGAIYIVRNPLDVVISLARHYDANMDNAITMLNDPRTVLIKGDKTVDQIYGSWSSHVMSWAQLGKSQMVTVRYEDMLKFPKKTFGQITTYLGLKPSKKRLIKAIKFSSFDTLKRQELEKGFRERPNDNDRFFRVGKAGQWKEILSDSQVDRIVTCHHDKMKEFGYLPK
ncbi:MAG: sulfotransferase domain-containing protein [Sneathiella sp.]|uniref:sulfotransferase domain-containing protein n=1 Tax=Sneathiella sp. TaxID=1964365 RepID=UPI0030022D7D